VSDSAVPAIVPPSPLGVYVHFPWCRRRCPYCDFAVEIAVEPPHREYLAAVLGELEDQAPRFAGRSLVSIYFGGGTPSLWQPECVAQLIAAVRGRWPAAAPLEITMEANPTDCQAERLAAWKAAGVTRLSVGVQSTRPDELALLGRDHRVGDGMAALERIGAAGGLELSADFIVGVPRQRQRRLPQAGGPAAELPSAELPAAELPAAELQWIDALAASPARHASVYELTIEEGAAFAKRVRDGRLTPRDGDALAELYVAIHDALAARGFLHYEISSYAQPGHRAVHNSLYWSGGDYLGLGVGAASYRRLEGGGAERWSNVRRFAAYRRARLAEQRAVPAAEDLTDRLWLGMRTSDGVLVEQLAALPGVVDWLLAQRLATLEAGRVAPTVRGFLFADAIAERISSATPAGF
jgi:coproporphyrinogen III oxidase-like Fe-S oxidoreductase